MSVEHPTGEFSVEMEMEEGDGLPKIKRAALLRTARRLFEGSALIPSGVWDGSNPAAIDPCRATHKNSVTGPLRDIMADRLIIIMKELKHRQAKKVEYIAEPSDMNGVNDRRKIGLTSGKAGLLSWIWPA